MGWVITAGIIFALVVSVSLSVVSANAQSFYVTTSKGVYDEGERVVVAGTVSDAADRRPVFVTISSDQDECARQNVRPLRDGSFVSRPMTVISCGPGEFSVTATHVDAIVSNSFIVESKRQVADSLELRTMRATVAEAQGVVNTRVREMLNANLAIPERAAEAYSNGVADASLMEQAIERGNVLAAEEHRTAALAHFREVLDLLSPDKVKAVVGEVREEQVRIYAVGEWFGRLQDLFNKLVNLADKNNIAAEQEFSQIGKFLDEARQLLNERNSARAEDSLRSADRLLEEARKKLIQQAEGDDSQAHALTSAADRLTDLAYDLRKDAKDVPRALAKVNASFVLIKGANSSIADGDYDSAKVSLDSAFRKLQEAQTLLSK